ncbi:hypothetical protein LXL04_001259 [Taraxacum kok-saghyz]
MRLWRKKQQSSVGTEIKNIYLEQWGKKQQASVMRLWRNRTFVDDYTTCRWRNCSRRGRRVQALERRWWRRSEMVGNETGEGFAGCFFGEFLLLLCSHIRLSSYDLISFAAATLNIGAIKGYLIHCWACSSSCRHGRKIWNSSLAFFKTRPPRPRSCRFYKGGFQLTMTRLEADLILGVRFDVVIISPQDWFERQDAKIFQTALDEINVGASKVVYVDTRQYSEHCRKCWRFLLVVPIWIIKSSRENGLQDVKEDTEKGYRRLSDFAASSRYTIIKPPSLNSNRVYLLPSLINDSAFEPFVEPLH